MSSQQADLNHVTSVFSSRLTLVPAIPLLAASLHYHIPHLTVLLLFIILLIGLTFFWGTRALHSLEYVVSTDRSRLFPGEEIQLRITVTNRKILPVWVEIFPFFDKKQFLQRAETKQRMALFWNERTTIIFRLQAQQRGIYSLGCDSLVAGDFFGFFPRHQQGATGCEVIVFPRLIPLGHFSIPARQFFGTPGRKSPVQDPVYFSGTREYQHSTPARMIHWKTSARHDFLFEKLCEPSVLGKTLLLVEAQGFLHPNAPSRYERALEVCASAAAHFHRLGHQIGFMTNATIAGGYNGAVLPDTRTRAITPHLELMARMGSESEQDLINLLTHYFHALWGVHIILFCHRATEATVSQTQRLCSQKGLSLTIIEAVAGESDKTAFTGLAQILALDEVCP